MRLRRADPRAPGYTRRRYGGGFGYRDSDGRALDAAEVEAGVGVLRALGRHLAAALCGAQP